MSNSRKILLIDYDPESIESTKGTLIQAGYEVEVANDGIAGVEAFERLKPDLVLIEPMVPKRHGFQVCQEIKSTAAGRGTPVLITTGFYRGRKHRDEAHESYGCDAYLEKPIAAELLLSTCSKFLIDTQEPPIPVSEQPGASISLAIPASEVSSPESGPGLVDSFPDLPIPEHKAPSKLQALDDLTEEEIQERLDAMIIGEASPSDEPPVVDMPEPVIDEAPEVPVEQPAVPITPTGPEVASKVETTTAQTTDATVESLLSRQPAHRPAPPEVAPHEAVESPAKSKLPLWIGIAAGFFIVAGIAILWMLREQGPADPSVETASMSIGQPSPTPSSAPATPSPIQLPIAPVRDIDQTEVVDELGVAAAPDATVLSDANPAVPVETAPAAAALDTETATPPETRTTTKPVASELEPSSPPEDGVEVGRGLNTDEAIGASAAATAAVATKPVTSELEPAPAVTDDSMDTAEAPTETATPKSATQVPAIVQTPSTRTPPPPAEIEPPVAPPTPKTRRGDLVDLAEVDQAPVVKSRPMPAYPPGAVSMRIEGTVNLRLLVDEQGRVEQVEVDSGTKSKQLQRAARQAAEQWVYEPGVKDGVPVKVWVLADVRFKL